MHLIALPAEILVKIFKHLSPHGKCNVALTCKMLRDIIYLKDMWINSSAKLKLECSAMKNRADSKRFKSDPDTSWPAIVFKSLHKRGIKEVVILSLNYKRFKSDMELLSESMPCLSYLTFGTEVIRNSTEFTFSMKSIIFSNLQSLNMSFNSSVNNSVLQSVVISMPLLRYLYLSHCRYVNDECAQLLLKLQHLEMLDLCATEISDKGIAMICGYIQKKSGWLIPDKSRPILSKLSSLNIDLCCFVTCKSWAFLGRLPSLNTLITRSLEVACTSDVQHLVSINSLTCLYSKGNMTNEALRHFSENGCKLQSLLMPVCSVDDTGAKYFSKGFDNLIFLSLNSKSITDDGVKIICHSLPQLILLDLTACYKITDQSLKCIGYSLLNLIFLSIVLCLRITSRGLAYIPSHCYVRSSISDEQLVSFSNKKMHSKSDAQQWLKTVKQLSFFSVDFF